MVTVNIRTSRDNQEIVTNLTRKLPIGTSENVIARIALGYSLASNDKFTEDDFALYDSQGKEYKDQILFEASLKDYYIALVCQKYGIEKNNEQIPRLIKLHIDRGLQLINQKFIDTPEYSFYDFFMETLTRGCDALDINLPSSEPVPNPKLNISKSIYSGPINIKVGYDLKSGDPINFCFNNTKKYSNPHIAVAGKSGTGKTQFALEFLYQLHQQTSGKVNFLFMDFKGLSEDDQKHYDKFFKSTETTFINAPSVSFPFNPLSFINKADDKNKLLGINKFVDIIERYAVLGKNQVQALRNAVKQAFENAPDDGCPSISDVYGCLQENYEKADKLTEIMSNLSEYAVFKEDANDPTDFLNHNYYFSLSGGLDEAIRFTSVFLVLNYISTVFANMGSADNTDGYQSMRYVLLIDEAHTLFKNKKSHDTLESLLRVMRSYGVSIFLLSQGIQEYNQGSFDFSQECETAFLLPIQDMTNLKSISKFLGLTDKETSRLNSHLDKLSVEQAISNIKEYPKTEPFRPVKYYQEEQNR